MDEEQGDGELHKVDHHDVDRLDDLEEEYERYQIREILLIYTFKKQSCLSGQVSFQQVFSYSN